MARAEDGSLISIEIRTDSDAQRILEGLEIHWPPRGLAKISRPESSRPVAHVRLAMVDGALDVLADGVSVPGGWDRVESTLGLFAAEHLSNLVALHAALILTDVGAIVLPGSSHAGKSTLAWEARRRGMHVLGDEYTLIDPSTGRVQGWPRPVRRRTPSGLERWVSSAEEHSLAHVDHRVALVAAVRFDPTSDAMAGMKRSDMVLRVLENTVCARNRPEDSFRAALALTDNAHLIGGTRAESSAALDHLLEMSCRRVENH